MSRTARKAGSARAVGPGMESRPTRDLRRDSVGNRTTLTEPDGYSYTFGYDELNHCIRLRDPNANVITLQYDTAGQRTTLLDSSGLTRAYAYDPAGRLTTQIDFNGATPIGTFVDSYDAAGIRTGRVQDGVSVSWTYDDIYRLIGQTKSGQAATFSYDAGGNILTKHHEGSNPLTVSYDAANRLTTSILGATQLTTYTYSNAGEMTVERCDQLGIWSTLVYDGEHRCLNELRASGANHTYTYGFDGLRRSALMGGAGNAVSFVWDGTDVLNEYVPGGLSGRYLTLDGEVLSEKRGASRYVYGVDPLGSVVHLIDSGLNRAGTYVYWPYGEVLGHTGVDTPLQYVGRRGYYTATTNRLYVRARWLRVDLGRWMTEDPIPIRGGSGYAYCWTTPTTLSDPLGLYPGYGPGPFGDWMIDLWHRLRDYWSFPHVPRFFPRDDLVFKYGNYCGKDNRHDPAWCRRRRHPHDPKVPPKAQDCVDGACQQHDDCLARVDWFSKAGWLCHCALAARVVACQDLGECSTAPNPYGCSIAAESIANTFMAICAALGLFVLGGPGSYVDRPLPPGPSIAPMPRVGRSPVYP